jgi:ankyrin repeat protein
VYYAISATFSRTIQGSPRFELVFKRRMDFFPGTIMLAVKTDDLEALKMCLKLDPDAINCVVPGTGWGPLHIAIELGYIRSTRFLLQQGSDLDQVDDYGRSAGGSFIFNLLSGRYEGQMLRQFSELISTSKYLEDLELSHLSKVVVGICQGDIHKLVKTLTKEELDHKDAIFQMTAVHWAAVRQDDTTLRALLDAGASPDLDNLTGVRPLSFCLKKGENPAAISCFEALASYGADLNYRDPVIGWQPLHWTCRTNCVQIARRLVAAGTDVNSRALKPGVNDTPAAALAAWWGSFDVLKFLVDNGADIEADNGVGHTSLVAGLLQNQHACLRFLLENGADYLLPELPGENILHLVAELGDAETMRIFSAVRMRGLDIVERNKAGLTPREIFRRRPATDKTHQTAFEELLASVEALDEAEDGLSDDDGDLFFDAEETK